jgi:hypothetical protein
MVPPAGTTQGAEAGAAAGAVPADQTAAVPALETAGGQARAGENVAVPGYIDPALPRTMFRLRYDAAYDDNRPDRAEFFYPKCGCFQTAAFPFRDPKASGPSLAETSIDYQDITGYLEVALDPRFSAFLEVPWRMLNPEVNKDASGFSDINAGFKAALLYEKDQIVTFQFRTYAPTGDGDRGLGTDHVSLEPALLVHQMLTEKMGLDAELRDWIPIGGSDFAGNVIRYGAGISYEVYREHDLWVTPIVELVGWTVLSGKEFGGTLPPTDASGDTIVNVKVGARVGFGEHSDVYAGYGRALTGDVWYKDILRVEYRLAF